VRFRVLAIASLIALAGCHQTAPPGDAPSNVAVEPGDGRVTVTWNPEPDHTYWIFYQPGSSVVPAAPGVAIVFDALSPQVVANLANGTQYAFIMNATWSDSSAGPNSPIVVQTPRLAGADWFPGAAFGTTQNINGIAFSGSRLVVVGDSATIFAGDYNYTSASPPVTAWLQPTTLPAPATTNFSAVTFSSQFVALGTNGSILTSADGLTWTSAATIPTGGANMNSIAFGAGLYVAVGTGGSIFTSPNLVTWTRVANGGNALYSVSFLNGGFVATGAGGTLLTSANGSTWVAQTSSTLNALRAAAFRSTPTGLYVAVGDSGTIVTSPDGAAWSPITLPGAPSLRGVTNGGALGTRFLAVGVGGAVVFSDDGSTWFPPSTPPPGLPDLTRVIFTPGMYVAVGATGANEFAK